MSAGTERRRYLIELMRTVLAGFAEGQDGLRRLVGIGSTIDQLQNVANPEWVARLRRIWFESIEAVYATALDRADKIGTFTLTDDNVRQVRNAVTEIGSLLDAFERGEHRVEGEVTLFRPVGPKELALIRESGYREFPPRLPEQPIFYPVLNEEYAAKIARDWNSKSTSTGHTGFVTRFHVRADFLSGYEVQTVGSRIHQEYWIPAEDLAELNHNIVGPIDVIAEFRNGAPL